MKFLCRLISVRALVIFKITCNLIMLIFVQSGRISYIWCPFLLPWPTLWNFINLQSSTRVLKPDENCSSAGFSWRVWSPSKRSQRHSGEQPRLAAKGLEQSDRVEQSAEPPACGQLGLGLQGGSCWALALRMTQSYLLSVITQCCACPRAVILTETSVCQPHVNNTLMCNCHSRPDLRHGVSGTHKHKRPESHIYLKSHMALASEIRLQMSVRCA